MIDLTLKPEAQTESHISVYDVAFLLGHIGNKPLLKKGRSDSITAESIQLAAFWSQGQSMAKNNRSLFKEDFYIKDGYIQNPEIMYLFGRPEKVIESFIPNDIQLVVLADPETGYTVQDNRMVRDIAFEIFPQNVDDLMDELRNETFYINALANSEGLIKKIDIMNYFKSKNMPGIKLDASSLDIYGEDLEISSEPIPLEELAW